MWRPWCTLPINTLGIPTVLLVKKATRLKGYMEIFINTRYGRPSFFLGNPPPPTLPGNQMSSVSNPFWTEVLERWKAILSKVPPNILIPFSNVCTPSLKRNSNYIQLLRLVDEHFNILSPSELKERLPLAD